MQISF